MKRSTLIKRILQSAVGLFIVFAMMDPVMAQNQTQNRNAARVGLGGQIGEPAGVTLKFRNPTGTSVDIFAAWSEDDFFFVNVHALWERHISRHQNLHLFYGPGAYVGVRDLVNEDDDTVAGISATVGLGLLLEQFEIFGQVTPRLDLAPATDSDIGVGVGVRYYF